MILEKYIIFFQHSIAIMAILLTFGDDDNGNFYSSIREKKRYK